MKKWEWIGKPNTVAVWLHCLLSANWEEKRWQGITIKRGSFITSYKNFSEHVGLSVQQTRTALANLQSTGELIIKSTNKYTEISINNYIEYQLNNKQTTNKQQQLKNIRI